MVYDDFPFAKAPDGELWPVINKKLMQNSMESK